MSSLKRLTSWADGNHSRHNPSILVIGLGRFGTALARTLASMEVEVMAVDENQDLVNEWAPVLHHVRQADTTSAETLRQLGADSFDAAVVAIGTDLEASILTVAALADLGIENIWAKAITNEHARILRRIGAHEVVFPENEMGERVAHMVTGEVADYIKIDDGFVMAELETPSFLVGQRLGETDLRKHHAVTVVCFKPRDGAFTYATAETLLGEGDLLLVAGATPDLERFVSRAVEARANT